MSGPIVELLGVEKTYRDFWGRARVKALAPLDLTVEPGEILALLGPNGAGKSTTIKLVLGLLFPSRGRVRVFGGSPRDPKTRSRLGYLPEETRLHKFLSPRETLDLFGRLHGASRPERRRRAEQLIDMVGLNANADRPVGEFSKGMARRIGLAVALSGDPDLLILDEPTSGLDPLGTREIKTLMSELRARGRSILLSSHLLDDVEDVADRVAVLYGGQLRRLGRTHELLVQSDRLRIDLRGDVPAAEVAQRVQAALPDALELEVSQPTDRLERFFRRVVLDAEASDAATAGARTGGAIAGFLLGGDAARVAPPPEPAPTPVAPAPEPSPEPAVAEPRVETLLAREEDPRPPSPGVAPPAAESPAPAPLASEAPATPLPQVASAPAPQPPAALDPELPPPTRTLLSRLIEGVELPDVKASAPQASPQPASSVDLSAASPSARELLARLIPGASPEPEVPDAQPFAEPTPKPHAPPEVSKTGRGVLERLLPPQGPA